jgi:hypothetical protein
MQKVDDTDTAINNTKNYGDNVDIERNIESQRYIVIGIAISVLN